MCGFSQNQHYCFTSTALRLNKNMFCFVAVPSRSCGFMNKISLQYIIPPAIQNLNSIQMTWPAMEDSILWKFHLGIDIYLTLSTYTYCWYGGQKTSPNPTLVELGPSPVDLQFDSHNLPATHFCAPPRGRPTVKFHFIVSEEILFLWKYPWCYDILHPLGGGVMS